MIPDPSYEKNAARKNSSRAIRAGAIYRIHAIPTWYYDCAKNGQEGLSSDVVEFGWGIKGYPGAVAPGS